MEIFPSSPALRWSRLRWKLHWRDLGIKGRRSWPLEVLI
jgi:hypothetical protein